MRSLSWILAIAVLSSSVLAADVDMSSPKAAVKSLYSAVQRVDTSAVRQLLYVENDPQQELATAYGKIILAAKRVSDAAKQKWPGSQNQITQGTIAPEDIAKIDSAVVSINGDRAVLRMVGRTDPTNLRRVDGNWRIVVGEGAGANDTLPNHRGERLALLEKMYQAMNQTADEISADKYPTIQEAEAAIKQRMGAVIAKAEADAPTSRPTTQK